MRYLIIYHVIANRKLCEYKSNHIKFQKYGVYSSSNSNNMGLEDQPVILEPHT